MCAVFSRSEQIISGSDDRTVKVWDLRNMRSAITSIQCASAVNRLSISHSGLIAIPQDNRHVVIHEAGTGHKVSRLPRDSNTHHRMVTSTAWAHDSDQIPQQQQAVEGGKLRQKPNLFSAGFDRAAFGWSIRPELKA